MLEKTPESFQEQGVSLEVLSLIRELQGIACLETFNLGGGTSLAIRYNHRISEDIDLMSSQSFSLKEIEHIEDKLVDYFGERIKNTSIPNNIPGEKEAHLFIRLEIKYTNKHSDFIKVEILQSIYQEEAAPEIIKGIKVIPEKVIGSLKMSALLNRNAHKDIHDISYLIDSIGFINLVENYDNYVTQIKDNKKLSGSFEQGNSELIKNEPNQLLFFENHFNSRIDQLKILPTHKNNKVFPTDGSKTVNACLIHYKSSVRSYFRHIGKRYPISTRYNPKRSGF